MMANSNNNPNWGLVVLVAVVSAIASSLVTYKVANCCNKAQFAVVDLQRVVVSSKDVKALKDERDAQIQDLKKMADDANEKIKAEESEEGKKKLSEQYLAEINTKKDSYDGMYASALQASDKKLNDIINSVAEKEGVSAVFLKNSLVQGGVDITDSVIDLVK